MAGGPALVPPPLGTVSTTLTETAALRARLAEAEADLTQTRADLSAAHANLTARDAAAAAPDAGGSGGAPTGASGGSGAAVDGVPAAPAATEDAGTVAAAVRPPADAGAGAGAPAGGAPLCADEVGAYARSEGDGADSVSGDYWGGPPGGGGWRRGGGRGARDGYDVAGVYDDGFDFYKSYTLDDWLQGFDIPRSVLRPDGMPMPFTPSNPVHTATFPVGSRDEVEARHWYCALAWLEKLYNNTLAARHATDNTAELLLEQLEYIVGVTRRVYGIGVSRYDYLAMRQSEPNLADAFSHADAVPRNSLRGDGARRFLSRVARAETHASDKIGAAERGFAYPQRANRVNAPAQPGWARSPARGGRGGPAARGGGGPRGGRGGGAGRGRGGARV